LGGHDAIGQFGGPLDGGQAEHGEVDRNVAPCRLLGEMGGRALTAQPTPYVPHIAAQVLGCVGHVDPERFVDRLVADPQPEDEAAIGGVGDQLGALGAGIAVAGVDVRDPCAHLDALRACAHELGRRHGIVVDLGGEDRVESRLLGLPGHSLDMSCALQPAPGMTVIASRSGCIRLLHSARGRLDELL
jgi:hypothetical protein